MYLHIGGGKVVKKENIIGIFDLETTSISKKTRDFLKSNDKKGIVKYVSEEIPKSFIILKSKNENEVYISQISSQTLYKRAERIEGFGAEN